MILLPPRRSVRSFLFVFACLALTGCSTTPEDVFAKYIEATNPSKMARPKSLMLRAKVSQESGFSGVVTPDQLMKVSEPDVHLHTVTIYCEYPIKIFMDGVEALMGPNGTGLGSKKFADIFVKRVFDGQAGWEVTSSPQNPSAGGTRDLPFYEVDKLRNMVDGAFAINVLDNVKNNKYIGEQAVEYSVNGTVVKKTAHVIEAFTTGGKKQTLFFDTADGLLIKSEETDPLSNNKLTSLLTNYRQFGSVRMPSVIKMIPSSGDSKTLILTIESLEFDVAGPEGAFEKPA
jgi:hypothetical protein